MFNEVIAANTAYTIETNCEMTTEFSNSKKDARLRFSVCE